MPSGTSNVKPLCAEKEPALPRRLDILHAATIGPRSVPIILWLEWTLLRNSKIVRLRRVELGELHSQLLQVQPSHLLVHLLGKHVDTQRELLRLGPEGDLGDHLIREAITHDKR